MKGLIAAAGAAVLAAAIAAAPARAAPEPLLTIGGPGNGAGQLDFPAGVTLSPVNGRMYVAEFDNDRISEFSSAGEFVRAFGLDVIPGGDTGFESCTVATGCKNGSGLTAAGGVNAPGSIHAAPNGHLFVPELDAERVSEFDERGRFVRAWGWDVIPGGATGFEVCDQASGCKNGVTGDGAGQFFAPVGITTDSKGNVWVAENQNGRVSEFSRDGEFIRAFGYDVIPGGAAEPEVCTTETGCQAGVSGAAVGQFQAPRAVGFDSRGNLAVVEQGNRVSLYAGTSFRRAWGFDVIPGMPAEFEICTPTTLCQPALPGAAPGQLMTPRGGIAIGAGDVFSVADTGNDRVNRYRRSGAFLDSFGTGVVDDPRGIAVDCRGGIWVGDGTATGLIHRFGEPGTGTRPCRLKIGAVKRNANGSAALSVTVPSAGRAVLGGAGIKRRKATAGASGEVRLMVSAKGAKAKELRRDGKTQVRARVAFTPPGGKSVKVTKRISLRRH